MDNLALIGAVVPFSEVTLDGMRQPGSDLAREDDGKGYSGMIRIGGTTSGNEGGSLANPACSLYVKVKLNADAEVWDRLEAHRRRGGKFRVSIEEV